MLIELSTRPDSYRMFSPLYWLGVLLRLYVALAFLLSGLVAAAAGIPILLCGGCVRLFAAVATAAGIKSNCAA